MNERSKEFWSKPVVITFKLGSHSSPVLLTDHVSGLGTEVFLALQSSKRRRAGSCIVGKEFDRYEI
jgi:hypothetical protein